MTHVSFTELRQNMASLFDRVSEDRDPLVVTRSGGKGNLVVLAEDEFAGCQETVHLLSSPKNAARLSPYQPSDIEDRYERRMREMIQAKLKGEGITPEAAEPAQSNVIDLMAALKRSLAAGAEAPAAEPQPSKKAAPGGKSAPDDKPAPPAQRSKAAAPAAPAKTAATKRPRKRA